MSADVVVVGSGAGGGLIAGELASRGRDVVLLEAGPHRTAADFTRWEAHAMHDIWWPTRFGSIDNGAEQIFIIGGRCVGGTTTINTKVALRAHDADFAKWSAGGWPPGRRRRRVRPLGPRLALLRGRGEARRAPARRLGPGRPQPRPRLRGDGPRARGVHRLHGLQLHEVRLLHPGLLDERGQEHDERVHPPAVAGGQARPARRVPGHPHPHRGPRRRADRRRRRVHRPRRADAGRRG